MLAHAEDCRPFGMTDSRLSELERTSTAFNQYKTENAQKKPEVKDSVRRDAILAMQEPFMQQIVSGQKNHEFRRYRINPTVERVWFYRTAPHLSIE